MTRPPVRLWRDELGRCRVDGEPVRVGGSYISDRGGLADPEHPHEVDGVGGVVRLVEEPVANPAAFEPGLAASLQRLSNRLSSVAREEEALAATDEAVQMYRRLAATDPAEFELDLASALFYMGKDLSRLGRREEALAATDEAVQVYRRLAATDPAKLNNLADSLADLGSRLWEVGRRDEALTATDEAAQLRRQHIVGHEP